MAKKKNAVPQASPLQGNVAVFGAAEFQQRFDAWLKQNDAVKAMGEIRELEGRIRTGEDKLRAAERRGVAPDDAGYRAAVEKLGGLRSRREELTRTAQVPHFAFATAHNFLRASRGWGLPAGSRIEIRVPGVFDVAVDLAESEIPF